LSFKAFFVDSIILNSYGSVLSSIFFNFFSQLSILNSRSFFFKFESLRIAFLFLEFDLDLSGFVLFLIGKVNKFLSLVPHFFKSLSSDSHLLSEMLALNSQLLDIVD